MDTFIFEAIDRPDTIRLREETRPAHRQHIRTARPDARCVLGGPIRPGEGGAMVGTLLVFLATDAEAVRRFMADDPYVRAGLFEHWSVQTWSIGLGAIAPLAE